MQQQMQQQMQMQMQQQEQLPAPSGAVTVDEAGNPDGGVDANTMNGAMQ